MVKLLLSLMIMVISMVPAIAGADDAEVMLLTEAEGTMKNETHYGFAPTQTLQDSGPAVQIVTPDMDQDQKPPFRLQVKFIPKPGSYVQPETLVVEALKFATLDITSRVRPFTTSRGIEIEKAKVPKGVHKIKLSISDSKGGTTQQIYVIKVI